MTGFAVALGLGGSWWLRQPADPAGSAYQPRGSAGSRVADHPGDPLPGIALSGSQLLALRLPDAEGKAHTLAEWSGRPLVINFWATWCNPCREELPLLTAAAQQPEYQGVTVVGIALDDATAVRDYLHAHALGYPVLVEDGSAGQEFAAKLGDNMGALPFTVLVDRQGRVVETRLGAWKDKELAVSLERLNKDAGTAASPAS